MRDANRKCMFGYHHQRYGIPQHVRLAVGQFSPSSYHQFVLLRDAVSQRYCKYSGNIPCPRQAHMPNISYLLDAPRVIDFVPHLGTYMALFLNCRRLRFRPSDSMDLTDFYR